MTVRKRAAAARASAPAATVHLSRVATRGARLPLEPPLFLRHPLFHTACTPAAPTIHFLTPSTTLRERVSGPSLAVGDLGQHGALDLRFPDKVMVY